MVGRSVLWLFLLIPSHSADVSTADADAGIIGGMDFIEIETYSESAFYLALKRNTIVCLSKYMTACLSDYLSLPVP